MSVVSNMGDVGGAVVLRSADARQERDAPDQAQTRMGSVLLPSFTEKDIDKMAKGAAEATGLLKALGHEGRLLILCHLSSGEKSVAELEQLLSSRQPAVSQQLARLRLEGIVKSRRDGKAIFYSLADERAQRLMKVVYEMFCAEDVGKEQT